MKSEFELTSSTVLIFKNQNYKKINLNGFSMFSSCTENVPYFKCATSNISAYSFKSLLHDDTLFCTVIERFFQSTHSCS